MKRNATSAIRKLRAVNVDVIVVGAGTAGIPAALAAADRGAAVVLVEKQAATGGMLHISGGHFSGAGTRRQRERGISDDPELHLADVERLSHGQANLPLVRASVLRQGETVDWLEDVGFDFHPDTPRFVYGHELYSAPRTEHGRDDGRSLLWLFQRELQRRVAAGTIDLRLSSRVRALLADSAGGVRGVAIVSGATGEAYDILAPAVVLATGGYAANRELVERLLPDRYRGALTACLDHATGDGLLMAQDFGANRTDYGIYLPTMSLIPDPDRPGFTLGYYEVRTMLVAADRRPHEIWVNLRGERWVAEDTLSPEEREHALLQQPELKMAIIWDQRAMDTADPILVPREKGWTRERIMAEAERGRFVWTGASLSDLAARMGVNADGLMRTVESYNRCVDAQHDPEFGRTVLPARIELAPFYGVVTQAAMLMSREGLCVDTDLRVLSAHDRPIGGLYAVGEVLGATQFMGDSFVGGMSVGPCITLGRVIGRRLADEALQRRTTASEARM
jgi:fumarate reductase flavoprotein subunit